MSGTFSMGEIKVRPGVYYRTTATQDVSSSAINGVLACLFQSDWGPLNKEVDLDITAQNTLSDYFGSNTDILKEGFTGGATTIRAIRVGDADGDYAQIVLKGIVTELVEVTDTATGDTTTDTSTENADTGTSTVDTENDTPANGADDDDASTDDTETGTSTSDTETGTSTGDTTTDTATGDTTTDTEVEPTYVEVEREVDAVVISAAYVGSRDFSVTVRTNLLTAQRQLVIYDGTEIFEQFSFEAGGDEAQALVDAMASSTNFNARKITSCVLSDVVQDVMTGGVNPTVTVRSYDKGSSLLERYKWNAIVADTDDRTVAGVLSSFVNQSYETGHLGMYVIGGTRDEDLEDRMAFAAALNDEKAVYLLNGWRDINGGIYEGWKAAARIGGMVSGFEASSSLTHTAIKNALELLEPLTNSQMIRAEQRGCLTLSLSDDDTVWIDSAINTLVTPAANQNSANKKIRVVKAGFELMTRINSALEKLIGKINNDMFGRGTVIAAANNICNEMVAEGKILSGECYEDESHPARGDYAYFNVAITTLDSMEKIYLTYQFSF